ncbi:CatB-related O-acetyltransferase [Hyunsoonleella ulvae]|uniref:CatB-related O-acetyltransferase n=1 Tax=Hyunsoonleella ulvae TaxID=2799948 RepID=UPI0019392ADB|nr:CatB-related O-acetyltransferase [Hyunsoonleella ulvae]
MMSRIRKILWRILGIDFRHTMRIHDYIFLDKDKYTSIGKKSYNNGALIWRWTSAPINIGKYCSIANGAKFIADAGYHTSSSVTSFPLINNFYKDNQKRFQELKKSILDTIPQKEGITIGNDVWIGIGATILPGVSIGNGATVGSNTVVTKDVPDYAIVVGSPGQVIGYKHDEKIREKLNKIAWWDWSEDLVKERIADFYGDIDSFIEKYGKK